MVEIDQEEFMIRKLLILGTILFSLTGCYVSSKLALNGEGGRSFYNVAVQKTSKEEMLLNLVRLRYADIPYFLNVSNVTTQFTFGAKGTATVPIPGFTKLQPSALGGEVSWQNQPTIQYTPLEGQSYSTQMLRPIDLRALQQLIFTGWDIHRIFTVIVQSLDGVPNAIQASSPTPSYVPMYEKFQDIIALLRKFQVAGDLQIGVRHQETPQHQHSSEGEVMLSAIQISFPSSNENSDRLAGLLNGIKKVKGKYILNMSLGYNQAAEIGVMTRSLIGCMYFLCLGVKVPAIDIEQGAVFETKYPDGRTFDWSQILGDVIQIENSLESPRHSFVSIKYRNHWFYIPDNYVESKRTFSLLMQLYNIQSEETSSTGPFLSIPLG